MKCESAEVEYVAEVPGEHLPVMESFYSIQGEGFHQGKAAHFIRLAGCDVGCPWCDVKESWDQSNHAVQSVDDLVKTLGNQVEIVIVTGGEPTMHNLDPLSEAMADRKIALHLETSGTNSLTGNWDWICFSPKKYKQSLNEYYDTADELKVIVYNESDLAWAEDHAARVNSECKLFLQPEWSRESRMAPIIVDYIGENPQWRISLQIHKYLNVR